MKKNWEKVRTCFCGKAFMPRHHSQRFCCPGHARVWDRARQSAYGRDLIKKDPAAALRWYDYLIDR